MIEVKTDTLSPMIKRLTTKIDEKVNKPTTKEAAEMIIEENVARIGEGKTPKGRAQTQNKQSTIDRKGHTTALRGRGHVLEDGSLYKTLRMSATKVRMFLPIQRERIVGWLKEDTKFRKKYFYWAIPNKIRGMKTSSFVKARWVKHFKDLANG